MATNKVGEIKRLARRFNFGGVALGASVSTIKLNRYLCLSGALSISNDV